MDADITISSRVEIGDTIYVLSTTEWSGFTATVMETQSSNFSFNETNGKTKIFAHFCFSNAKRIVKKVQNINPEIYNGVETVSK